MNWKDKTCDNCVFRVGSYCRRFPPIKKVIEAASCEVFLPACAEYAEEGQISQVVRNAVLAFLNEPISPESSFQPLVQIAGSEQTAPAHE